MSEHPVTPPVVEQAIESASIFPKDFKCLSFDQLMHTASSRMQELGFTHLTIIELSDTFKLPRLDVVESLFLLPDEDREKILKKIGPSAHKSTENYIKLRKVIAECRSKQIPYNTQVLADRFGGTLQNVWNIVNALGPNASGRLGIRFRDKTEKPKKTPMAKSQKTEKVADPLQIMMTAYANAVRKVFADGRDVSKITPEAMERALIKDASVARKPTVQAIRDFLRFNPTFIENALKNENEGEVL